MTILTKNSNKLEYILSIITIFKYSKNIKLCGEQKDE